MTEREQSVIVDSLYEPTTMLSGQWSLRRQERPTQDTQQQLPDISVSFDNGDGTIFLTQSEILQLDPMMDSMMVEDVAVFDDESHNISQARDEDHPQNISGQDEVGEKENGSMVDEDSHAPPMPHHSKLASWTESRSPTTPSSSSVLTPKVENANTSGEARRSTYFSPNQISSRSFTFDRFENPEKDQSGPTDSRLLSLSVAHDENSLLVGGSAASVREYQTLFERQGMPDEIADDDFCGHVDDDSVEKEIASNLEPMQKYFMSGHKLGSSSDSSGEVLSPLSQDRSHRNENVSLPSFQSGEVYEDCDEDSGDQLPTLKLKLEAITRTSIIAETCSIEDEPKSETNQPKSETNQDPYHWAYEVWRKKGLLGNRKMATPIAPIFDGAAPEKPKEIKLQTPNESCVPFDFRGFEDDPVSLPKNKDRLSLPSISAPKLDQSRRKSFANILQHWREKSDDKPNSHFLSPEPSSPVRQSAKLKANDSLDVVSMQLKQKMRRETTPEVLEEKEQYKAMNRDGGSANSNATPVLQTMHLSNIPLRRPSPRLSPVREASQTSLNSEEDHSRIKNTNLESVKISSPPRLSLGREKSQSNLRIEEDAPGRKNSDEVLRPFEAKSVASERLSPPFQPVAPPSPKPISPPSQASIITSGLRMQDVTKIDATQTAQTTVQRPHVAPSELAYTGILPKGKNDYKSVVRKVLCVVRERSISVPRPPKETKCDGRPKSAPRTSRKSLPGRKSEAGGRYKAVQQVDPLSDEDMLKYRWGDPLASQRAVDRRKYHESDRGFYVQQSPRRLSVSPSIRQHLPRSPGLLGSKQLLPSPFSAQSTSALGALPFDDDIEDRNDDDDVRLEELTQKATDFLTRSTSAGSTNRFSHYSGDRSDLKVSKFAAVHEKSHKTVQQMLESPIRPRSRGKAHGASPSSKELIEKIECGLDLHSVISPPQRTVSRPWNHDIVVQRVGKVQNEASDVSIDIDQLTPRTCQCSKSVFSGNDELIEFFLPLMGMACSCGKRSKGLVNPDEPTALENILRPWQVEFLAAFGIYRGDQLVKAHHRSANALASALRQYRKKHNMTPFRTKSCGMALQIWSKTSKAFVRSIRNQLIAGKELKVPNTLYIVSSFLEQIPTGSPAGTTPRAEEFESVQLEL